MRSLCVFTIGLQYGNKRLTTHISDIGGDSNFAEICFCNIKHMSRLPFYVCFEFEIFGRLDTFPVTARVLQGVICSSEKTCTILFIIRLCCGVGDSRQQIMHGMASLLFQDRRNNPDYSASYESRTGVISVRFRRLKHIVRPLEQL